MLSSFGVRMALGVSAAALGIVTQVGAASATVPKSELVQVGQARMILQLPYGYDPAKRYPLILLLHGRGGNIDNMNFIEPEWAAFRVKAAARGFVLAMPAYGEDSWFNDAGERIVMDCLDYVRKRVRTVPDRLYVSGVSMGGGSTLAFALRHARSVAAICEILGMTDYTRFYDESSYQGSMGPAFGGSPKEKPEAYRSRSGVQNAAKLKRVPVMIIHGEADELVPISHAEQLEKALTEEGGHVAFIRVPGLGHTNAVVTGLEDRILDFFSTWRRGARKIAGSGGS